MAIHNPYGEFEHFGYEDDKAVAEAMAYAAKSLIDNILEAVNNVEPNADFAVILERPHEGAF